MSGRIYLSGEVFVQITAQIKSNFLAEWAETPPSTESISRFKLMHNLNLYWETQLNEMKGLFRKVSALSF